jgi:hypothetical protein
MKLILYGTSACHLCEVAEQYIQHVLALNPQTNHIEIQKVDIALNDDLVSNYGLIIPVLKRPDNQSQLQWPFSEVEIKHLISR